jgi:hypothetical protein
MSTVSKRSADPVPPSQCDAHPLLHPAVGYRGDGGDNADVRFDTSRRFGWLARLVRSS